MKIIKLDDAVAVSEQVLPSDAAEIAAAGYRVLINNRPDGEAPGQPSSAEIASAAAACGLEYHYFPVTAHSFPGDSLGAMGSMFNDKQRPVLAFCRTGTRSTNLWVASQPAAAQPVAAAHARALGYDLAMADAYRT